MVEEAGQLVERVLFAMLHHHEGAGFHQLGAEYAAGDCLEARHVVGRVGEHDVEGCRGRIDEAQSIAAHQGEVVYAQLLGHLGYEALLCGCLLHGRGMGAAATQELECNGTGAGEKVESVGAFYVDDILDYIEYVLAGKIGSRPCRDVCGHVEASAAVFSSYYSHSGISTSGRGAKCVSIPGRMAAEG